MKKLLFSILAILLIYTSIQSVFADEIYPSHPFRWKYSIYNYEKNIRYCYLYTNNDGLKHNEWNSAYWYSIANWDAYGGGQVDCIDHVYNGSRVDFREPTNWPTAWPEETVARTQAYDSNSNIATYNQSDPNRACDKYIAFAAVVVNNYYNDKLTVNEKKYTLAHEIGHVLGLGHPRDKKDISIMETGGFPKDSKGNYFWWPKQHDRNDLKEFYTKTK